MSEKQDYEKKLSARLDQMDAEIKALQAKTKLAEAGASKEAKQQMNDLREKRDKAQKKLEQLRGSADEAWADIKTGAEYAWTSLSAALKSAKARFD